MTTIEEKELLQHAMDFIGNYNLFPEFIDYVAKKENFTNEEKNALDWDIELNFPNNGN